MTDGYRAIEHGHLHRDGHPGPAVIRVLPGEEDDDG